MLNFIERWFGVSPDSGNGALEYFLLMLLIFLLIIGITIVLRHWAR
jgi:hypothetical protein